MEAEGTVSTVIIVESCFGNTRHVAEALAEGSRDAILYRADEAPDVLPPTTDLVLVGAPTHGMKLPSPGSRSNAARRKTPGARAFREAAGIETECSAEKGTAEWIAGARLPDGVRVVTFDTSIKGAGTLLGCAAKDAAKRLTRAGAKAERGLSFWVTPKDELVDGELRRATEWARTLA
jgi:hypothetical protein